MTLNSIMKHQDSFFILLLKSALTVTKLEKSLVLSCSENINVFVYVLKTVAKENYFKMSVLKNVLTNTLEECMEGNVCY